MEWIIGAMIAVVLLIAALVYISSRKEGNIVDDKAINNIKQNNNNLPILIEDIIKEIDKHYELHKDNQNDKTNYNVVAELRIIKANYQKFFGDEDYYHKQVWYTLSDNLRNPVLLERLVDKFGDESL